MKKIKKVVLAYSGGLDTSVIIKWLKDNYGCEVVAYSSYVGQGENLEPLKKKAIKTGASKIIIEDVQEEFAKNYILKALNANAVYEDKYFLATALTRPLIAKRLVEVARKEKADAIVHGCTGKGNDQVRIEAGIQALGPEFDIIAPVRTWELKSREEEIEYAKKHKIPINVTKKKVYSIDKSLWGISIECGVLEDPWNEPPEDAFIITKSPLKAPNKPEYLELYFDKGTPKKLNGQSFKLVKLIETLNKIGGKHGVGRTDMVENRLVGIKSREIYEQPAALILSNAHKELEALVLDRETLHYKKLIAEKYAELVYYGLWYSPLRDAFDAFVEKTQEYVTGTVRLKLFKGKLSVVGRKSKFSLYNENLATYTEKDEFDQKLAKGFIDLWSLPTKVVGKVRKR